MDTVLKSYNKVQSVEQNWYSVGSINLPTPINPSIALYFLTIAGSMVILDQIIPIPIPGAFKYFIIPYLLTRKVTEVKKDGKNLIKYYISYIPYKLKEKVEYEFFKPCKVEKEVEFYF